MSEKGREGQGEDARLRSALRSLARAEANPAFQRRLRADFVSGRIAESSPPTRRGRVLQFPGDVRWRWAAAAVLAVGVFAAGLEVTQRGSWEVMTADGSGAILVQGDPIPVSNPATLSRRLAGGGRLQTPVEVGVDLLGDESVALGIAPGTDLEVQRPPGRWFGRSTEVRLFAGELRILTGPDFPGARLAVRTPEGMVRLQGTAVAVYRDSSLTCICVLEGTAAIGIDEAQLEDVPAGKRKVLFADARQPEVLDIEPHHAVDLQQFVRRARPHFVTSQP